MAVSLIFNLVSRLLVWHPKGKTHNLAPMTVTEWVCDIIAIIIYFVGILMMFFDFAKYEKKN